MKKVAFLTICNYFFLPLRIEAKLESGEIVQLSKYTDLLKFDVSGLRAFGGDFNRLGKFTCFSSANFVGRQFRKALSA